MEDGNSVYSYKLTQNCYAKFCTEYGIILMPYPSTSPNMNLIEKCWRRIKQALYRCWKQPTTVAKIERIVQEE
jgi:transposase